MKRNCQMMALMVAIFLTAILPILTQAKWKEKGDAKTFGGKGNDVPQALCKAKDGFLVGGYTRATNNSDAELWVIKLDKDGNKDWEIKGAVGKVNSVLATDDGAFLVGGYLQGAGVKTGAVTKLDKKGKEVWERNLGNYVNYILQTKDGNYLLIGAAKSEGKGSDVMAAKYDKDGKQLWAFNYGASFGEAGNFAIENPDGSFMIAGTQDTDSQGVYSDMYLLQIDKDGKLTLYKNYGSAKGEEGQFVFRMKDGNYLLAGMSTGMGKGGAEVVFVKVDKDGNKIWDKPWGGELADYILDMRPLGDDFLFAGTSKSFGDTDGDGYFAKLDQDGNVSWIKYYGLKGWPDQIRAFVPSESGYLFALNTQNFGDQSENLWMLKVDKDGDCKIKGCPGVK